MCVMELIGRLSIHEIYIKKTHWSYLIPIRGIMILKLVFWLLETREEKFPPKECSLQ